jgi:hypothetical protein
VPGLLADKSGAVPNSPDMARIVAFFLEPFIFKWKPFDGMDFRSSQENTAVTMPRIVRGF